MEKQQNPRANGHFLVRGLDSDTRRQQQKAKISKLGGIHLYNEDYKRHLCVNSTQNEHRKKFSFNSAATSKKDEQQLTIQHEITDFLQHRQQYKFNINSVFTSQIQKIIQTFKTSHISTNRFLEEHQNKNEQIDNLSLFSFQELFESEKNKNKTKYTRLMGKVLQQFRETVMKEIAKMKLDQLNRVKEKENFQKTSATQTPNQHENQAVLLKKELERKEAEYNALYDYKRNMINEGENNLKNYEMKCQFQQSLIGKLQNQVAAKNLEIRGLQRALKETQDRLFNRILELQNLYTNSQGKESLSSIKQLNPYDFIREKSMLSNFLFKLNNKKNRYKRRAESILSVTQSLFSNMKDNDIIASMVDIAAKSLRDVEVHFDHDIDDECFDELQKLSKNSAEAQNLFKILEIYKKNKNRSSIEKINKKVKNRVVNLSKNTQRNSSQLGVKIDRQYFRGSFRQQSTNKSQVNSKDKEQKRKESKFPPKKLSRQEMVKEQSKKKQSFIRKKSIQRKSTEMASLQTALTPVIKIPMSSEVRQIKPSIFKVSMKDIPITSNKSVDITNSQNQVNENQRESRKKLKKGVSFQIEGAPNLDLHSLEVNICIDNTSKKLTCETIYNNAMVNERPLQCTLENFDKHRFSKNKLMKTKLKENVHKKVNSELDSQTQSTLGWNTVNNQKAVLTHNATVNNFYRPSLFTGQKERFSCHTSQEKNVTFDGDNKGKPRNSYSRMQRSTIVGAEVDKQMKLVKQLAIKYKNRAEYHQKLINMHSGCAQNCEHIRRYLQYFDKCREHNRKENIKLKIENLNNNIRPPLPTLNK